MIEQFTRLKHPFRQYTRIESITPSDPRYRVTQLERPCKRNTQRDIAVILSHLTAMHAAVSDTASTSDIALIIEDDVKIIYDIDYKSLAASVKSMWGVLQLVTSNPEAINNLYATYSNNIESNNLNLWTRNLWYNSLALFTVSLFHLLNHLSFTHSLTHTHSHHSHTQSLTHSL